LASQGIPSIIHAMIKYRLTTYVYGFRMMFAMDKDAPTGGFPAILHHVGEIRM
jgi:hypothetical protein